MKLTPVGALQRPFLFVPYLDDVVAPVPDLQPHPGRRGDIPAAQVPVEERELGLACFLAVEGGPFRPAVRVGVAVFGVGVLEGPHRPDAVEVVVGEAGALQDRDPDLRHVGRDGLPPRVAEGMLAALGGVVGVQAGDAAGQEQPDAGEPVLGDTTGGEEVAVAVGEPFPRADRLQRGRVQRGDLVLREREIGHAEHARLHWKTPCPGTPGSPGRCPHTGDSRACSPFAKAACRN